MPTECLSRIIHIWGSGQAMSPWIVSVAFGKGHQCGTEIDQIQDLGIGARNSGLAVFGTIYLFHQNGGLTGTQFPQRFVAIGWVVGLRWCAWIIPLYFLCVITEIFAGETNVLEFLLDAMTETLLVHRIGFHIRDVALRTTASAAQAQPT